MDSRILYNAEELLSNEIDDIVDTKRNGKQLNSDDICCLKNMLRGVESINRILMLQQADQDYNTDIKAFEDRATRNGYGYDSTREGHSGGARYSSHSNYNRTGDARSMIEEKMNMARDEHERMIYQNLLSELDRR